MRYLITRSRMLQSVAILTVLAATHNLNHTNGIQVMDIQTTDAQSSSEAHLTNPLLAKWQGPYGGVPPFDRVKVADFKPALEAAMAENLSEVDRVAKDPAAPTFQNTIVALERAGKTLDRVQTIYGVFGSTMNGPDFQVVQREMAPRLAGFYDQITQNEALFKRIEAVYNSPEKAKLTPEQQRLTWLYYTNFVRAGAKLGTEAKARLSEINQKLAGLYTKFSQNVLATPPRPRPQRRSRPERG
jgi:peptidyl-dipeptidase Dcp